MFTVKWIASNGAEMIYAVDRDVSFTPSDTQRSDPVKACVAFYEAGSLQHVTLDSGEVYVMNAQGRTVSKYIIASTEYPHGMIPKAA